MQEDIGIDIVTRETVRKGGRKLLPIRHGDRSTLSIEIGDIHDRMSGLLEIGAARQVLVPGNCLLSPGNVAGIVLAEETQSDTRFVLTVGKWLVIRGVKNNAIDAAREVLVCKLF